MPEVMPLKRKGEGSAQFASGDTLPASIVPKVARVTVANLAARYALTTATVRNGYTVYQTDTGATYLIVDDSNLSVSSGYHLLPPVGVEKASGGAQYKFPRYDSAGKLVDSNLSGDGSTITSSVQMTLQSGLNFTTGNMVLYRGGGSRIELGSSTSLLTDGATSCAGWRNASGKGILSAANLAVGGPALNPGRKFEVVDGSGVPQDRCSYTQDSVFTDRQTDFQGNYNLKPTGGKMRIYRSDLIRYLEFDIGANGIKFTAGGGAFEFDLTNGFSRMILPNNFKLGNGANWSDQNDNEFIYFLAGRRWDIDMGVRHDGSIADGDSSSLKLLPSYTPNSTTLAVTRHNYFELRTPIETGAATVTDACVFRFPSAAGTHKALDSGTTKTTPGGVDAWLKINVAGTIYHLPCYTSKTA